MSKVVIADSSCLIGLSKIGRLEVLRDLFGEVFIPQAVYHEVVEKGAGKAGSDSVRVAKWIVCKSIDNQLAAKALHINHLRAGECEAMILAIESKADFVIIDDGNARKSALALELPVIGTVSILHKAAEKGFLNDLLDVLMQLKNVGFRFQ